MKIAVKHAFNFIFQHRVASLLACDRILVFEDGKVVEDGSPKDLMQRPMGFFSAMLRSAEEANETLSNSLKHS